ncbi:MULTISPECIES: hypothetical protein [unclassified Brevibacterium]|uniref:hypothetical protein n=1 Tax=unclassified Brevibacterium TaxID=2614124 RepID=UPI001E5549B8|nr:MULTISPECIES: hypothetical protein [unclassified Brevibacterium]MDK8434746.1 hypothetical protein [Brevibacterium sp. H-BE7]
MTERSEEAGRSEEGARSEVDASAAEPAAAAEEDAPDSGTAVIEFIFASIVLLIPVVYLMLAISQLQAASYATTSTAISASRIAARDADPSERRAHEVATMHFSDFGLKDVPISIAYSCAGPCGRAGSLVTARVETKVSLPGFPLLFGANRSPHITLRASHSDVVATTGEG